VRIEDVDEPRTVPGAAGDILRTLEAYGFQWDGPVIYQSERGEIYRAALERLRERGLAFPCGCTRAEAGGGPYPGTCRNGLQGKAARAYRLRVEDAPIEFEDRLLGRQSFNLAQECGDFVLRRADGCWAYQLAVTVDDAAQGITHVVRGRDLLDSTPRQIRLQRCLGYRGLSYMHVPVATDAQGNKLSKQTRAPAIRADNANEVLRQALGFLGFDAPHVLLSELWPWAEANWAVAGPARQLS
jgi:glutamyl-Q tRNA(Asp) synthetase